MSASSLRSHAFILHKMDYQDNSLIIHALSRENGKLSLLSKGVKKSKKSWSNILHPFNELDISFLVKEGLSILTQADLLCHFQHKDLRRHYCAYYINELIMRLLPEKEYCIHTYDLYRQVIGELFSEYEIEPLLRKFELQLLSILGYEINLATDCLSGDNIVPEKSYYYITQTGFVECQQAEHYKECQKLIKMTGDVIIALAENDFSQSNFNRQIKQLLRLIISQYTGDKPLKSRLAFSQMFTASG